MGGRSWKPKTALSQEGSWQGEIIGLKNFKRKDTENSLSKEKGNKESKVALKDGNLMTHKREQKEELIPKQS